MGGYILKRLVSAVPVLLGITVIVFTIMALIPGDPATAILGSYATPENVEKLNRDLGLDKPLVQQYFIWIGNLLQGDFGRSFALNRPVLDEVLDRFSATLVLAGAAFVLCAIFAPQVATHDPIERPWMRIALARHVDRGVAEALQTGRGPGRVDLTHEPAHLIDAGR